MAKKFLTDIDMEGNKIADVANATSDTDVPSYGQARNRANHTGSQTASTISDIQSTITNNSSVVANTAKVSNATHTGDVTGSAALTIANNAVSNVKLADMPTTRIKGRIATGTGDPQDLTPAQVRAMLNVADGAQVNTVTSVASKTGAVTLVKNDVGLGNVDNTSDANKPVSTAQANAIANASAEDRKRANHTGTQPASTISDLQTAITNNTSVKANTAKVTNQTHTGDVAGSTTLTIVNNAVNNAKIANNAVSEEKIANRAVSNNKLAEMPANTIKGRNVTSGLPVDLSPANVRAMLNVADGAQANVGTNIAQGTRTTTAVPITSSTGTNATLTAATTTLAGVMTSADKVKLNGIANGAQVNTVTSVASKTGAVTLNKADVGLSNVDNTSDANKPVSTAQANAISTANTANRNRANHTGTQLASTISNFNSAGDTRWVNKSGDTMSGNLDIPNAIANTHAVNRQTGDARWMRKVNQDNTQTLGYFNRDLKTVVIPLVPSSNNSIGYGRSSVVGKFTFFRGATGSGIRQYSVDVMCATAYSATISNVSGANATEFSLCTFMLNGTRWLGLRVGGSNFQDKRINFSGESDFSTVVPSGVTPPRSTDQFAVLAFSATENTEIFNSIQTVAGNRDSSFLQNVHIPNATADTHAVNRQTGDARWVGLTGNQSISGEKTFNDPLTININTLGQKRGDSRTISEYKAYSGNQNYMIQTWRRFRDGNNWTSSEFVMTPRIDSTNFSGLGWTNDRWFCGSNATDDTHIVNRRSVKNADIGALTTASGAIQASDSINTAVSKLDNKSKKATFYDGDPNNIIISGDYRISAHANLPFENMHWLTHIQHPTLDSWAHQTVHTTSQTIPHITAMRRKINGVWEDWRTIGDLISESQWRTLPMGNTTLTIPRGKTLTINGARTQGVSRTMTFNDIRGHVTTHSVNEGSTAYPIQTQYHTSIMLSEQNESTYDIKITNCGGSLVMVGTQYTNRMGNHRIVHIGGIKLSSSSVLISRNTDAEGVNEVKYKIE